ncbi:MAG TPA: MaoC family dehydratase N-terminal domain-containing protein [Acidimicrobiales bacterium]|nr:MaoC family dehydratase N-terminal domain-containing protein [Acidimicrobiales bacterium]
MADAPLAGREGREFEMAVERGKVREFAAAVLADHPAFFDGPHPVIPPTFLVTWLFWQPEDAAVWGENELDPARSVHGEQEYVFHGPPPRAGAELRGSTRVERDEVKEGRRGGRMRVVVSVTEFRDEAGRLVAEERNTGIELGQVPS